MVKQDTYAKLHAHLKQVCRAVYTYAWEALRASIDNDKKKIVTVPTTKMILYDASQGPRCLGSDDNHGSLALLISPPQRRVHMLAYLYNYTLTSTSTLPLQNTHLNVRPDDAKDTEDTSLGA